MANKKDIILSSSMEDYLETIAVLKKDQGVARVKDISLMMQVKKPSVTSALNCLSLNGLVIHERYGYVDLTPEGERLAQNVQKRHDMLIKFLVEILGINKSIAEKDACQMEHAISPQTNERLGEFIEFVEACPAGARPQWLKNFDNFLKKGKKCKKT